MDQKQPAADRVRGVLQAMERSIDNARRRRLHASGAAPTEAPPSPRPALPPSTSDPVHGPASLRLKARPKRSSTPPAYGRQSA